MDNPNHERNYHGGPSMTNEFTPTALQYNQKTML